MNEDTLKAVRAISDRLYSLALQLDDILSEDTVEVPLLRSLTENLFDVAQNVENLITKEAPRV